MKKNLVAGTLVLFLTGIAAWFILKDKSFTLKKELSDFAIEDTASITRIFLADKTGKKVTLNRVSDSRWKVNNDYEAREETINTLLKTIKDVRVKHPVPKSAFEFAVKMLATNSTKVEIYQGENKPSKIYYVGIHTPDNYGTYMMMENSSSPFITHIPGFNGYLTQRYFTDMEAWRNPVIFAYSPKELERVEVRFFEKPEGSFVIDKISSGKPELSSPVTGKTYPDYDTMLVYQYLGGYQKANAEYYATNVTTPSFRDSLERLYKNFTISVTDIYGNKKTVQAFYNPMPEGSVNDDGKPMIYDPDRMYAYINNGKDIVVIQYYVFDNLTPPVSAFLKNSAIVKK